MKRTFIVISVFLCSFFVLWFSWEIINDMTMKEREPNDIGYVVFHHETVYFVKGENLEKSHLEDFSEEDIWRASPFEQVSILMDAELKITTNGIKHGEKVAIWYDEVLESYPAQIK
mgnify:CR=1 FL=1